MMWRTCFVISGCGWRCQAATTGCGKRLLCCFTAPGRRPERSGSDWWIDLQLASLEKAVISSCSVVNLTYTGRYMRDWWIALPLEISWDQGIAVVSSCSYALSHHC